MLDTWTLRILVEVADRGSFSAAAESLSMTQPAVSRQISGLERRVGVPLFRRIPRGIRATQAGEVAIEQARDILVRLDALQARLGTFTGLTAGTLRMSAFPGANTAFTPEAIRRFSATHPGVALTLERTDPAGPLSAIRAGTVDLALLTAWDLPADPVTDLDITSLLDEELLLALPAGHPLAAKRRVRLRDLRDQAWIEGAHPDCLGPLTHLSDALGGPPRIAFTCDDWNGKQALVAAGAGITVVPTLARTAIRRGVVLRPTAPALPARRLFVATAPPPFRPPAATAMLAVLAALSACHRATARAASKGPAEAERDAPATMPQRDSGR